MRISEHFLFYVKDIGEKNFVLNEEETRHAVGVLRLKPGHTVRVTNGCGAVADGTVESIVRDQAICTITHRETVSELAPRITCYIGLPERDAFETALELLTPLGVTRIVPLVCEFSQKPWWENWDRHEDRFTKKLIAGCKQSLNAWLPELLTAQDFAIALGTATGTILHGHTQGASLVACAPQILSATEIALFVGPPGGFSESEFAALASCGIAVSYSPHRLRTEHAAAMGVGILRAILLQANACGL